MAGKTKATRVTQPATPSKGLGTVTRIQDAFQRLYDVTVMLTQLRCDITNEPQPDLDFCHDCLSLASILQGGPDYIQDVCDRLTNEIHKIRDLTLA